MTGEHLDYDTIRADTVRQVAKLMAAAAITAPKSGGQLFLAGKHNFMETVIVDDPAARAELAAWMRARGKERREQIWFRDAEVAEAVHAVLFVGLADWYPPNYDCGACGYATCAEFLHATKALRDDSAELEFAGPTCNLRDIELGIAVGSAAKTAAIHSIDCRCQTRIAVAARKLGVIRADVAVALSLSMTHKAVGFDRRMPDVDFDALDLPTSGILPVGVEGESRHGGARHRQRPRRPVRSSQATERPMSAVTAGTFTHDHIALTATIIGAISAVFGLWRLSGPCRFARRAGRRRPGRRRCLPMAGISKHAPAQQRRLAGLLGQRLARTDHHLCRRQHLRRPHPTNQSPPIRPSPSGRHHRRLRYQRHHDLAAPVQSPEHAQSPDAMPQEPADHSYRTANQVGSLRARLRVCGSRHASFKRRCPHSAEMDVISYTSCCGYEWETLGQKSGSREPADWGEPFYDCAAGAGVSRVPNGST
jgi:uncharacterized ferredoxin-like protein